EIVEVVRDAARKLSDCLHSLGLAQCGLRLLPLADLDLEAPVEVLEIVRALLHHGLDAPRVSGAEQEQCAQQAGAEDTDDKNRPALPNSVLGQVRLGRGSLHTITPPAEGERVAEGGGTRGKRK